MVDFGQRVAPVGGAWFDGGPLRGVPLPARASAGDPAANHNPPGGVQTARLTELVADEPPGPRRANRHVIMLVTAGRGSHALDFAPHICRPGTLVWGRPGQVHHFGRQAWLDATLVAFDSHTMLAHPALRDLVNDPFAAAAWQATGEDEDAIVAEVAQLAADCARFADATPAELADALLTYQLAVLLVRMAGLAPAPRQGAAADMLGRLRVAVELEVGSRRVEEYAELLGCSVRTLTRACLAETGRSAKQIIDERVALEAKRLLACTDLAVAEVGRRLGFEEPTNFGRFFTREVGSTPGAFRAGAANPPTPPVLAIQRSALPGRLTPGYR